MKSFEEMMAAIEDKEKEEIQRSISVIDPDPAAAMKPLPTMLDDIEKEERAPLHPFGTPEVQGSAESVGISKFDEIVSFLSPIPFTAGQFRAKRQQSVAAGKAALGAYTNIGVSIGTALDLADAALFGDDTPDSAVRLMFEGINRAADKWFPDDPDLKESFISTTFPKVLGDALGQLSQAYTLKGQGKKIQIGAIAIGAGLRQAQEMKAEAERGDATPKQQTWAWLAGLPIGALEVASQMRVLGRLIGKPAKGLSSLLKLNPGIGQAALDTAMEEGIEEALQGLASGAATKKIWDDRRQWSDIAKQAAVGAGLGAAVGGLIGVGTQGMSRSVAESLGLKNLNKERRDAILELSRSEGGSEAVAEYHAEEMIQRVEDKLAFFDSLPTEMQDEFYNDYLPRGRPAEEVENIRGNEILLLDKMSEYLQHKGRSSEDIVRGPSKVVTKWQKAKGLLRQWEHLPRDEEHALAIFTFRKNKAAEENLEHDVANLLGGMLPRVGGEGVGGWVRKKVQATMETVAAMQKKNVLPQAVQFKDNIMDTAYRDAYGVQNLGRPAYVPNDKVDPARLIMELSYKRWRLQDQIAGAARGEPFYLGSRNVEQIQEELDYHEQVILEMRPEIQKGLSDFEIRRKGTFQGAERAKLKYGVSQSVDGPYLHKDILHYEGTPGTSSFRKSRVVAEEARLSSDMGQKFDTNTFGPEADQAYLAESVTLINKAEHATNIIKHFEVGGAMRTVLDVDNTAMAKGVAPVVNNPLSRVKLGLLVAQRAAEMGVEDEAKYLQSMGLSQSMFDRQVAAVEKAAAETTEKAAAETTEETETETETKEPLNIIEAADAQIEASKGFLESIIGEKLPLNSVLHSPQVARVLRGLSLREGDLGSKARDLQGAVNFRNALVRIVNGKAHKNWQKYVDSSKYTLVRPMPGYPLYIAPNWIVEKTDTQIQTGLKKLGFSDQAIQDALAFGYVAPLVLPNEIAAQLERQKKGPREPHPVESLFMGPAVQVSKMTQLFASWGGTGYPVRNLVSDTDGIFASCPATLMAIARSPYSLFNRTMTFLDPNVESDPALEKIARIGTVGDASTFTTSEIKLAREAFPSIAKKLSGQDMTAEKIRSYLSTVSFGPGVKFSKVRETMFRLADYETRLKQLKSGKKIYYGSANAYAIESIRAAYGDEDAAASLASQDLGDYGNKSMLGQWLARYMVPFEGWVEVVVPRYWNLTHNAFASGFLSDDVGRLGVAITARLLMAMIAGAALSQIWNRLLHGKLESTLSPANRADIHLIVKENDDTSAMILRNAGALGDVSEWGGLPTLLAMVPQLSAGQVTAEEVMEEMGLSVLNKAFNMFGPQKFVFEVTTGYSLFPSVTEPHKANRGEIVAGYFKALDIMKAVDPLHKGWTARPHLAQRLAMGVVDPRIEALSQIWDMKAKYAKKKTGVDADSYWRVSKVKVMRDAAKAGNFDAFKKAKAIYIANGSKASNFKMSLSRMHPLAGMSRADRLEFQHVFLTGQQRENLLPVATDYSLKLKGQMMTWWQLDQDGLRPEDTR